MSDSALQQREIPWPDLVRRGAAAGLDEAELERRLEARHADPVRIGQPMVLVSQVQRSGGTLISELLDGHPQIHAHGYELHIGRPTKYDWPRLDPAAAPREWLDSLREGWIEEAFSRGYRKYARGKPGQGYAGEELESLPFVLPPGLQEEIFIRLVAEGRPRSQREILDAYMTSYFNAWLDYDGVEHEGKQWVAAFAPRLAWGAGRRGFFDAYPDGALISCLRDPKDFYASARRGHRERYGVIEEAIGLWRTGTEEMLAAQEERPDQTLLLAFETVVRDTKRAMREVARFLEVEFDRSLLTPTFNGRPIKANSSFPISGHGIVRRTVKRAREELSAAERKCIEEWVGDVYREARARVSV